MEKLIFLKLFILQSVICKFIIFVFYIPFSDSSWQLLQSTDSITQLKGKTIYFKSELNLNITSSSYGKLESFKLIMDFSLFDSKSIRISLGKFKIGI
jgi:hypothetical protein